MIGSRYSLASRCKDHNPSIFIAGCPCHPAHLVASEANDAITQLSSNAEEERLFSIVRKNKTDSCSSLKLEDTLLSILAMKSRFQESVVPCYKWQPEEEVVKNAKKHL